MINDDDLSLNELASKTHINVRPTDFIIPEAAYFIEMRRKWNMNKRNYSSLTEFIEAEEEHEKERKKRNAYYKNYRLRS